MTTMPTVRTPSEIAFADLKEQATLAFRSGLLPRSVDTVEKAIIIALAGKELGLSPMQALSGIYVVNGMFALRGATMLRLIYERVPGAQITVLTPPDKSDRECVVEMKRPNGSAQRFRYTIDEAKQAGFGGKPIWQQHTSTMLRWAAIRTGARIVFADAIAGCYMEDEIENEAPSAAQEQAATIQALVTSQAEPVPPSPAESLPAALAAPAVGDYIIPTGIPKWAGKTLAEVAKAEAGAIADYCISKREQAEREKKPLNAKLREFVEKAEAYLTGIES